MWIHIMDTLCDVVSPTEICSVLHNFRCYQVQPSDTDIVFILYLYSENVQACKREIFVTFVTTNLLNPIFDTIYGLYFFQQWQCMHILQLPLCIIVFLVSGGARHSSAQFKLPLHTRRIHRKPCMTVILLLFVILSH